MAADQPQKKQIEKKIHVKPKTSPDRIGSKPSKTDKKSK